MFRSIFLLVINTVIVGSFASELQYFRIDAKDYRKCGPYPRCGGFYISKLNVPLPSIYVGLVKFSKLKHVKKTVTTFVESFGYNYVVFGGQLVVNKQFRDLRDLRVDVVYLGYPGVNSQGSAFYQIQTTNGTAKASLISRKSTVTVNRTSVMPISPNDNWQANQIVKGAIVSADIKPSTIGSRLPSISIKQVYIKLPVVVGPCKQVKILCSANETLVYTRDVQLCFTPRCIKNSDTLVCIQGFQDCGVGYRLVGWPAPPGGCYEYKCDPVFLPKASKLPW